jgi:hypothetical protein
MIMRATPLPAVEGNYDFVAAHMGLGASLQMTPAGLAKLLLTGSAALTAATLSLKKFAFADGGYVLSAGCLQAVCKFSTPCSAREGCCCCCVGSC